MIYAANAAEVANERTRRQLSGGGGGGGGGGGVGWTTTFFGAPADGPLDIIAGPQAYLVEQEPNSCVRPHFHDEDQFQVIVSGGGMLNRHAISAPAIHYANRQTAYGPIIAGEEGFTLRGNGAMGAHFLPGAAGKADSGIDRQQITADVAASRPSSRSDATLVSPTMDRLAAWSIELASNEIGTLPDGRVDEGRFVVVLDGEAHLGNAQLAPRGNASVVGDDAVATLAAGPLGARVLILQMPTFSRTQ